MLPMSEIKLKARKYSLLLCVGSLVIENYLNFKKKQLLLDSIGQDGLEYELSASEKTNLEILEKA